MTTILLSLVSNSKMAKGPSSKTAVTRIWLLFHPSPTILGKLQGLLYL